MLLIWLHEEGKKKFETCMIYEPVTDNIGLRRTNTANACLSWGLLGKMAICCPQGGGTLPPSHLVVPKLSQSCVGNIPILSQSCPKVVPKLPQSSRKNGSILCRSSRDGYCYCIVNMNEPKCKTVTAVIAWALSKIVKHISLDSLQGLKPLFLYRRLEHLSAVQCPLKR